MGELITPIKFTKLVSDETTKIINEITVTMYEQRISLSDIRMKLLKDHEQLGIVRLTNQSKDDNLFDNENDTALITKKFHLMPHTHKQQSLSFFIKLNK